jgi:hypothetical protein
MAALFLYKRDESIMEQRNFHKEKQLATFVAYYILGSNKVKDKVVPVLN